jgi:1-phosphofructokinase
MTISNFVVGQTNRGQVDQVDPGGKGINVAKAAKQLGCPVLALGFLAGYGGRFISNALIAQGILTDFLDVPGETRVNLKIKDPLNGTETEINQAGFRVTAEYLEALAGKIEMHAGRCAVMVFSGSLPPGAPPDTYARFIGIARKSGVETILDTSGTALDCGLSACPDLVKPNLAEAEELLQLSLAGEPQRIHAARQFLARGAGAVVLSMGREGALAANADGCWRMFPPAIHALSSIGSGDAMVAALAYAILKRMPFIEALRLATAAGAATAAAEGSSVADLHAIESLLSQVVIKETTEAAEVSS